MNVEVGNEEGDTTTEDSVGWLLQEVTKIMLTNKAKNLYFKLSSMQLTS